MFDVDAIIKGIFFLGAAAAATLLLLGWGICALVRWLF